MRRHANLKFRFHTVLFFMFIVNAMRRQTSFEIQIMLTKSRREMLMRIRTPISNSRLTVIGRRRLQLPFWIHSKLRNDGTSVFAPNYLVIYAKCCRTISSSELSLSLNKSVENDSTFRPLHDTRRNKTINDASTIQDKDYTFLQCKQTSNRCSRVHLPFR